MTKAANLNPANTKQQTTQTNATGFAALINVKTSRYFKREYQGDLAPKVGIKWVMGTTKGNTFDRIWSTGVPWDDALVSADGKQFYGEIKSGSDAFYFLQKIVAGGYPADKLGTDVSVFEGETFFMTEDTNPKIKGSTRKLYPKQYHPEGWDAALGAALERRAAREAQENAKSYSSSTAAEYQGSYTPPPVVQTSNDVIHAATDALSWILTNNSGIISRDRIPAALAQYVTTTGKAWDDTYRRNVQIALWDINQLKAVVGNNSAWKMEGETISYNK